jgi:hypothetical protein
MSQFLVSRDGSQFGPYDEAQSRSLFAQGNIAATDLVWCEGMSAWQPAADFFGVASATNGPAAPPMPPPIRKPMTLGYTSPQGAYPAMATNQQIHPKGSNESDPISESWKRRFFLIEKAGGPKLSKIRDLSPGERMKVFNNIWASFFGPFYYLSKGMWKKAISLLAFSVVFFVIFTLFYWPTRSSLRFSMSFVCFTVNFGIRANIDYYKKMILNDNGWW